MIVVLAPFPSEDNEKDGMIQRVAYIDALMATRKRVYLKISSRRYLRKRIVSRGDATVYNLNLFLHANIIARLLMSASLVYIHSVHNALYFPWFRSRAHVVFDAHGVVPEEVRQQGNYFVAIWYSFVERYVLRRCDTLICVTNAMLDHFNFKHGVQVERKDLVLPILPPVSEVPDTDKVISSHRHELSVIYAGGVQVWQNLAMMFTAAERQKTMRYTFLTGDLAQFQDQLKGRSISMGDCLTVSPEKVKDYYLEHEYGFILRDDCLVNRVACPTKLVEYLYWGVIPIVITPRIGDFDVGSLRFIALNEFVCGQLPSRSERQVMRLHNHNIILRMLASAKYAESEVARLFGS